MHKGIKELNFTFAVVQYERVKEISLHTFYTNFCAQRHCIWLPEPCVFPFYLPLVVHYCRPSDL